MYQFDTPTRDFPYDHTSPSQLSSNLINFSSLVYVSSISLFQLTFPLPLGTIYSFWGRGKSLHLPHATCTQWGQREAWSWEPRVMTKFQRPPGILHLRVKHQLKSELRAEFQKEAKETWPKPSTESTCTDSELETWKWTRAKHIEVNGQGSKLSPKKQKSCLQLENGGEQGWGWGFWAERKGEDQVPRSPEPQTVTTVPLVTSLGTLSAFLNSAYVLPNKTPQVNRSENMNHTWVWGFGVFIFLDKMTSNIVLEKWLIFGKLFLLLVASWKHWTVLPIVLLLGEVKQNQIDGVTSRHVH